MLFFFLQLTRVGAYCSSPMIQGAYHSVLGCNCMMAVPMQILICVSWLFIDSGVQSAIFIWGDQHVKKRYGAIFSRFFTCKMDVIINGIYVFKKGIFLCFRMTVKVSSTNLFHSVQGMGLWQGLCFQDLT